jgi:hypothetical protein
MGRRIEGLQEDPGRRRGYLLLPFSSCRLSIPFPRLVEPGSIGRSRPKFEFRYKEKRSLPRIPIVVAKVGLASPPIESSV